MKVFVPWSVKVCGSGLILGLTLWLLPTGEVWSTVGRVPGGLWIASLAVFLLGHAIAAGKWWLIAASGADVPFGAALRAHFAGLAANLCLPGVAGGDVVRAGVVVSQSERKARIAAGSVVDRIVDTVGLLLLSSAGALFVFDRGEWLGGPLPKLGFLVILCIGLVVLVLLLLPRILRIRMLGDLASELAEFRHRERSVLACLGLSVLVQSVFVIVNFEIAIATGVELPLAAWFFAWPLAKLLAIAPISLAGLGVREAGLGALLAPLGGIPARVVGVSLLWQTILFAAGVIGAIAFAVSGRIRRQSDASHTVPAESDL